MEAKTREKENAYTIWISPFSYFITLPPSPLWYSENHILFGNIFTDLCKISYLLDTVQANQCRNTITEESLSTGSTIKDTCVSLIPSVSKSTCELPNRERDISVRGIGQNLNKLAFVQLALWFLRTNSNVLLFLLCLLLFSEKQKSFIYLWITLFIFQLSLFSLLVCNNIMKLYICA